MNNDNTFALRLVSGPVSEPLSLTQVKAFLRVEHEADDDVIARTITAARQAAEAYLDLTLLAQTLELRVANPCTGSITLPCGPAQSLVSVTASTLDGTNTALDASRLRLSVDGRKLIIDPAVQTDVLTVQYVAGLFSDVSAVPGPILQGMLHHIAAMTQAREGTTGLPRQALVCYQPYRRIAL